MSAGHSLVTALMLAAACGQVRFEFVEDSSCSLEEGQGSPLPDAWASELRPRTLVAATDHSCVITSDGIVCWGSNTRGQLGREGGQSSSPVLVREGSWLELTAEGNHTCARDAENSVFCWGLNRAGQLGLEDVEDRAVPTRVESLADTVALSVGYEGSCALSKDGMMDCWGSNAEGMLGSCSPVAQPTPTPVVMQPWRSMDLGQGHMCGISAERALYCWGRNVNDELGQGSGSSIQQRQPVLVSSGPWRDVRAGQNHTCGLLQNGELQCWGWNSSGQLGVGDARPRPLPTTLAGGPYDHLSLDTFHTCAISSGALYCWGRNTEGQLGLEDVEDRNTPTRVGVDSDWVEVAVGRFHTCARRTEGSVWCTGEGADGRLGLGDTERRSAFTQVVVSD